MTTIYFYSLGGLKSLYVLLDQKISQPAKYLSIIPHIYIRIDSSCVHVRDILKSSPPNPHPSMPAKNPPPIHHDYIAFRELYPTPRSYADNIKARERGKRSRRQVALK